MAPWFVAALGDFDWRVRLKAVEGLGQYGGPENRANIEPLLNDSVWWIRFRAGEALQRLQHAMPTLDGVERKERSKKTRPKAAAAKAKSPDPGRGAKQSFKTAIAEKEATYNSSDRPRSSKAGASVMTGFTPIELAMTGARSIGWLVIGGALIQNLTYLGQLFVAQRALSSNRLSRIRTYSGDGLPQSFRLSR